VFNTPTLLRARRLGSAHTNRAEEARKNHIKPTGTADVPRLKILRDKTDARA